VALHGPASQKVAPLGSSNDRSAPTGAVPLWPLFQIVGPLDTAGAPKLAQGAKAVDAVAQPADRSVGRLKSARQQHSPLAVPS
jgi:hypothetical protein